MCGMAGVVNSPSVSEDNVKKMVDVIRYRGPDEAGVEKIGPAVIGHARLQVVDPENGKQPMSNTDDTVWVTFNGEIFNFVEIREELKSKGYKFKSRCDTEVLVHLWREEGEKMLDRLNGMFAFFLWDTKLNKGILARDRQGIKPCFISPYKGGWAFCSEIKGLLQLPDFPKEIDNNALKEVFIFNYCLPPNTVYKGVKHLEPGHYMLFEGDKDPVLKKYWEWPFFAEKKVTSHEEFAALIDDAVRMQMRFDVKGALNLSGGVDSSVVAAHLIKQWNTSKLDTYGLSFKEEKYSEFKNSQTMASFLNVNLQEVPIGYEMIPEIANKVSYHAEQPHGDFSFFILYLLARQANADGKIVCFNGDGPDEALLGFGHNVRYFHNQPRTNFSLKSYFDVISYMNNKDLSFILNDDFNRETKNPLDRFEEIMEPWRDLEPMEQIMAYECTSLMPGNNNVKGDRMGACWSTEGRSPLMDHRISEAMVRLPISEKFKDGIGKHYLKDYAAKILPHQLIYKEKTKPTAPIGEWMKKELYDWTHDLLSSNKNERLNTASMVQLLEEHKSGKANNTSKLRPLIMTQLWLRNYFS